MGPGHWLYSLPRRLRSLFLRRRADRELDEELRYHVERKTEEYVAQGMNAELARRTVLLELGGLEQAKERCRDMRGVNWIVDLGQDLRHGLRILRKSPGFAAVAILTLALGIGANTAIFSMVDWLMFRPLPIAQPQRVVEIETRYSDIGSGNGFSYPNFLDLRAQSASVFSAVAGIDQAEMDGLSAGGSAKPILTAYVTGNFFAAMGIRPVLGRFIAPVGGNLLPSEPVVVLGYSLWTGRFDRDPNVIGKSVLIDGRPVTIIGVAPKGFHGITSLFDTQAFLPMGLESSEPNRPHDLAVNRKSSAMQAIARLKPGVPLATAQAAVEAIGRRLAAQYPAANKWASLAAYPLRALGSPDPSNVSANHVLSALFLLLAGLVLLLACMNLANLLLARATVREREMAVRAALGAGKNRLIRQLLTESLLLALLGCAAGIAVGLVASRWLASVNFNISVPLVLDFQFDWRVFAYAFGLAAVGGLFVGIVPALRAARVDLSRRLHKESRSATASRHRAAGLLVAAEVAGALMLLIVAGLFTRSLLHVQRANLGFAPGQVVNFTVAPAEAGYSEARARELLQELLGRVRALPGVQTASLAATVPMGDTHLGSALIIPGYHTAPNRTPRAGYNAVSSEYFETMRIPVVQGRGIQDSDTAASPRIAVISQEMADNYWPGKNPIGQTFANIDKPNEPIKIVGVAGNVLEDFSRVGEPSSPFFYVSRAQDQNDRDAMSEPLLQVRASPPPPTVEREVLGVAHSLAPTMPVYGVQTMTEALDSINGLLLVQIGAVIAAALGALGLLLAVVGVYGVVSCATSQRTHEIGIRMALGARPSQILRLIFRQGLLIVAAGIVAGVLAAAGVAKLAASFLVGVSPLDATTFVAASLLLAIVTLAACYLPAHRAMRLDPMMALRSE